ncbi:MAG: sugar phosphate isomerase/epimerase [Clostridiaceae bacterium]|jgi:hexulose-6-phosphate isomerase|nr:sugar phosphate isomerase/epimerase [Clostridiaceae bacterium]
MKKGISIWSFTGQPLETCFQLARKAGFDGVEVALDEQGPIHLASTRQDMAAVRNAADRQGVDVTSVASGLYWTYSLTADEPDVRAKARSIVVQQLRVASWLGCDTILVLPGSVTCGFGPQAPVVPYDVAYDRSLEALHALAPVAADLGVAIGLENVWNNFLLSPLEMRSLIDAIDSPAVGAYFDVGNVLAFGYPEQWIRILGPRIRKVHIKDFRRGVGGLNGFVDLLAGDVDFPAVMAALAAVGYDDYLTAEMSPYRLYPETILVNTSSAMDRILGRTGLADKEV